MYKFSQAFVAFLMAALPFYAAQEQPAPGTKPTEHILGTIGAVDSAAHTITVKDDKSGAEQTVLLANTKTLIKVPPGAKDLKNFTRITADQLAPGDRVDVRGFKSSDDPSKIAARSLVLMSAQELQVVHQAQAAEWQNAVAGVVTSVDAAKQQIAITERSASGPKPVVIQASPQTEFTRYSPSAPGTPAASQLAQIQAGDQIRVIGEVNAEGSSIAARRVYSGAFRTLNGTVVSLAGDAKQLVVKDLASKKPVTLSVTESTAVQKIPPEIAARMAARFNPALRPAVPASRPAAGGDANVPPAGGPPPAVSPTEGAPHRSGDMSQLIARLPKIALNDLHAGDAVVVSGVLAADTGQFIATHIIAGVEPILQSAPARQRGETLGGDWGLGEMAAPQ